MVSKTTLFEVLEIKWTTRNSGSSGQFWAPSQTSLSALCTASLTSTPDPLTPVVNSSELIFTHSSTYPGSHGLGSLFSPGKAHSRSAGAATVLASHSFPRWVLEIAAGPRFYLVVASGGLYWLPCSSWGVCMILLHTGFVPLRSLVSQLHFLG